jgi:hypothetical protein
MHVCFLSNIFLVVQLRLCHLGRVLERVRDRPVSLAEKAIQHQGEHDGLSHTLCESSSIGEELA